MVGSGEKKKQWRKSVPARVVAPRVMNYRVGGDELLESDPD